MSEKITEHVDETKAYELQSLWYASKQKYKGQLDAMAFFYEQGWKECEEYHLKNQVPTKPSI